MIDTIKAPGQPGDLHTLRREEILAGQGAPDRLSPHDPSLRQALAAASLLGHSPESVLLIGIVPGENHLGIDLFPLMGRKRPGVNAANSALEMEVRHLARDTFHLDRQARTIDLVLLRQRVAIAVGR